MLTETLLRIGQFYPVSSPPWLQGNLQDLVVTCGFRYDFTGSLAASCMHFQGQNRRFSVFFESAGNFTRAS